VKFLLFWLETHLGEIIIRDCLSHLLILDSSTKVELVELEYQMKDEFASF